MWHYPSLWEQVSFGLFYWFLEIVVVVPLALLIRRTVFR